MKQKPFASKSQGSDSGRLEMKQKPFASKSQGSDSVRLEMKQKPFASKSQGSDSVRLEIKQKPFSSKKGKILVIFYITHSSYNTTKKPALAVNSSLSSGQ